MADSTIEVFNAISGAGGLGASDLFYVFRPGFTDLDFKATPDDIIIYVEANATAFADVSHTHVIADITDAGDLAALDVITNSEIVDGTISISKLSVNPLARANHTGTQLMSTISDAGDLATLDTINLGLIDNITANRIVGSDGTGDVVALTPTQVRTTINVEDGADVTDTANVDAAGAVMETDFGANTILVANTDDTPLALTVPTSTIVGRNSSGNIAALTTTQVRTLLNVTSGAEPNQNTFSIISVVGEDDIVADTKTDTLTLEAGNNITITTDASTDTVTISAPNFPVGDVQGPSIHPDNNLPLWEGANSKILKASGIFVDDVSNMSGVNNLTITGNLNGRDIDADGTKLDGIEAGAEVNQNAFAEIRVQGENEVFAMTPTDSFTLIAGDNVDIQTGGLNDDEITISVPSSGELGDVFAPASHATNIVPVWDGINTKTLKNSTITFTPTGDVTGVKDISLSGTVDGRDIATDGAKLDTIESGAEVNQNAFNTINVSGQDPVIADSVTDTLNLVGGTNVTITTDDTSDTITISATLVGTGDVLGPATNTDNTIARWDGVDSKTLQDSGIVIDDSDNLSGIGDLTLSGTVDGRDVAVDGAKLDTIQSGAQVTSTALVDAAGAVMESDYNAFTILAADVNDTPTSLTVSPSTFVGRKSTGGISAMSLTEARAELNVEDGAQVNQNSFSTIVVAGEDDILATSDDDTLTIIAGTNVTLDTNVTSRQLTINADLPPTSGDVTGPVSHSNDALAVWNGADTKSLRNSGVLLTSLNNMAGLNDLDLSGDITLLGTVDGRDVATDGTKLDGIESGAQVNQNAFTTIIVAGQNDVVADAESDDLTLAGDSSLIITTDDSTDTVSFSVGTITSSNILDGTIINDDISPTAAIDLSKLATNPLARANHTGTQLMSTISDAGALATLNSIDLTYIDNITADRLVGSDATGDVTERTPTQVRTLLNVADGAEVNQNAFSTIAVSGESDVVADSKTDTLTLAAGSGIAITTDAGTDTVTISRSAPAIISTAYVSPNQTITAGGQLNLTHGLGAAPKLILVQLVCTTATQGYSVGDVVFPFNMVHGNSVSKGCVVTANTTTLNVRFGTDVNTFALLNKTTGSSFNTTNANWALRVSAYA